MPRSRAVLFDLDDTLYPLRRFVRSGFRAVALHLERTRGIERHRAFAALTAANSGPQRGREFQAIAEQFAFSSRIVPDLVTIVREHRPSVRLPRQSALALAQLRPGWRLAVVTNGLPDVQARKVRALGLADRVDVVIFANEHGSGLGKPDAAPFLAALARLDVAPRRGVFVGDDAQRDIAGASAVGLHTVLYAAARQRPAAHAADALVRSLLDVPAAAAALVAGARGEGMRDVA
jgi:putative hydrolase of the HAD superfamily